MTIEFICIVVWIAIGAYIGSCIGFFTGYLMGRLDAWFEDSLKPKRKSDDK